MESLASAQENAESRLTFHCARCGIESSERTCFIIPERFGNPPHDIRCVTCEQRRLAAGAGRGVAGVIGTILWPLLILEQPERGPNAPGFLAFLFACLLYPAAVIAHELGHALTARAVGLEVGAVSIGYGRVVLRFAFRGVPVQIHMWPLSGRVYFGATATRLLRTRLWLATLMGPMTNALLLVAAVTCRGPLESILGAPMVTLWMVVNGLLIGFALLPHRFLDQGKIYRTDGLALLQIPRSTQLQLAPYLFSAPFMRAWSRFEAGNFADALPWAHKALTRAPDSVHVSVLLSACNISLGDYSAGIGVLEPILGRAASEDAPVRCVIYNNMAFALLMFNIGWGIRRLERMAHSADTLDAILNR